MTREPLKNEFSWSSSRAGRFERCLREYWLSCYGFWPGWERGATDRQKRLYILKNLRTRHSWAGLVIHDAAAGWLDRARAKGTAVGLPSSDEWIDRTRVRMREDFANSRAKNYYFIPKSFGLVEHEYGEPIPPEWWIEVWDKVQGGLKTFFTCETLRRALDAGIATWFPTESKSSFMLDGVRIWVEPDFAFRRPDGKIEVVDWKSGRPKPEDVQQLGVYGLSAVERWKADPAHLIGRLVYLGNPGLELEVDLGQDALDIARSRIRQSAEDMRALLVDVARNEAPEANYPKTDDLSKCRGCAFRGDCWPAGIVEEEW